jgi:hypothetical protein
MADVTTVFAAKDESFAKTVDNLQNRLSGFQGQTEGFSGRVAALAGEFAKFAIPIAGVAAAFLGAKNMAAAFTDAIRMGGELNDLAARTGESAGNLAILQRAFENAGSSASAVGPMINRLQRFIAEAGVESSTQAKTLAELGVSAETLGQKSPLEQMKMLAQLVAGIEDPTKRTQAAIDLFGKSGGELIPLLRAMGVELDTARRQLGSYPAAIDATREALDTIGDNFTAISNKSTEFATGLLTKLAPGLAEITTKIAEIDAAGFGMMLADYFDKMIRAASEAFKLGSAIENVKLAIEAITSGNFGEGLSLMWVTMKVTALNAINEIVSNFMAGLMTLGQFLATIFSPDGGFAALAARTIDFIGLTFESRMADAFATMLAGLPFISQSVIDNLVKISQAASLEATAMTYYMSSAAKQIGEDLGAAGRAMPENFEKNKASLQPIFDLTPVLQEQQQLHASIEEKLALQKTSTEAINSAGAGYAASLGIANAALESGGPLSAQIALNLTDASNAAAGIAPAFDLAAGSSAQIPLNLESTSTYAKESSQWLKEGEKASEQVSIHGSTLPGNAQAFAGAINQAKIDANATANVFTGLSDRMSSAVNSTSTMLDKMREAFHFGRTSAEEAYQKYRDGGMSILDASKAAAAHMAQQNEADTRLRSMETKASVAQNSHDRALRRAAEMESMGQQKSAHNLRMRADAKLTKTLEEISPELTKGAEDAGRLLGDGGSGAGDDVTAGGSSAEDSMTSGGAAAGESISTAASALKDAVSGMGKALALDATLVRCEGFLKSINEKLPQNALS